MDNCTLPSHFALGFPVRISVVPLYSLATPRQAPASGPLVQPVAVAYGWLELWATSSVPAAVLLVHCAPSVQARMAVARQRTGASLMRLVPGILDIWADAGR